MRDSATRRRPGRRTLSPSRPATPRHGGISRADLRRRQSRSLVSTAATGDDGRFLKPDRAFVLAADSAQPDRVTLDWEIADGYYLYRDRITVRSSTPDVAARRARLPDGETHHDDYFGDTDDLSRAARDRCARLARRSSARVATRDWLPGLRGRGALLSADQKADHGHPGPRGPGAGATATARPTRNAGRRRGRYAAFGAGHAGRPHPQRRPARHARVLLRRRACCCR